MSGEPQPEDCPLCQQTGQRIRRPGWPELRFYECRFCGSFAISSEVSDQVKDMEPRERARISAYTRSAAIREIRVTVLLRPPEEQERPYENAVALQDVLDSFPRTIAQRLDRGLMNLAKLSPLPGDEVSLSDRDHAVLYGEDKGPMGYLAEALEHAGLIHKRQAYQIGMQVRLTPSGWNRVAEIERSGGAADSRQAFVAMWFAREVEQAWTQGIKPGVEDAGFDPLRVNLKEHNEKICDLIIVEIRRSKFVVADVTGQRQGVYFEGGFAMGLSIPVIWTCREDEIDKCHFDTRQYNHIVWETPEDLHQKLLRRIQATIPQPSTGSS